MESKNFPFNPLNWPLGLDFPQNMEAVAWHEHIPFAMTLIQMLKPKIFVELGVHSGDSYLAFCQAVSRSGISTSCYGVDTWQGDSQAGYYGDEVFEKLKAIHEPQYSSFSRLIRGTFDYSVSGFAERTIDLLHIDGLHTFDAVKLDFETWLPKISSRGVVLFHDINVREMDFFGVWKLWQELKTKYPSFEFVHGHGLGVLAVGPEIIPEIKTLLDLPSEGAALVRQYFSKLGHYLTLSHRGKEAADGIELIRNTKQAYVDLRSAFDRLTTSNASLSNEIQNLNQRLEHSAAVLAEKSAVAGKLQGEVEGARTTCAAEIKKLSTQFTQASNASHEKSEQIKRIQYRTEWIERCEKARRLAQQMPTKELRVLFISDMTEAPLRYRVTHGVEQLLQNGDYARHLKSSECLPEWMEFFNVVVFFRQPMNERVDSLIQAAKHWKVTIVFDCDDLIFFKGAEHGLHFLESFPRAEQEEYAWMTEHLGQTFQRCEWFLGSTRALAEKATELHLPSLVHPNVLAQSQVVQGAWINQLRRLNPDEPILGYFSGSNTHDDDFRSIEEALVHVFERNQKVLFLLAGHYRKESFTKRFSDRVLRLPYLPWTEYPAVIARCHALLAPLATLTSFTHSKSALKYFESGLVGVPVIASPIAEMRDAIVDGRNGWLATTPDEWSERIMAALHTPTSLAVGQRARQDVLASHTGQALRGNLSALLRGIAIKSTMPSERAPVIPAPRPPQRSLRETARSYKRMGIYLFKNVRVWTIPAPPNFKPIDLLRSVPRDGSGHSTETTELILNVGSLNPESAECLTLDILVRPRNPIDYMHLCVYFQENGAATWDASPALVQQIAPLDTFQAHRVRLRVMPKSMLSIWKANRNVQRIKMNIDNGVPFVLRTFTLHLEDVTLIPHARTSFLRMGLGAKFLSDEGIEIGALQNPLPVPDRAKVHYVDVLTKAEAIAHFPELPASMLVEPTIIDNGQELKTVPDGTWNFCVANHVLEHTRKPLTALSNWLRVLKPGGILYVAIPDRTNKLDHKRPLTTFEHLLLDEQPQLDRSAENHAHFVEWAVHINKAQPGQAAENRAIELEKQGYNIHFHVFDISVFKRILELACREGNAEIQELHVQDEYGCVEHIAIIKKLPPKDALRRKVSIVMPVYNAYDHVVRTCESVLRHATGDWELIAVDDCSPDPRINKYLSDLAEGRAEIKLITNSVNGGFVVTANNGMRAADPESDIVLLNSDVEVTEGFLRKMQDVAFCTPKVNIVTPFSNNATIFSIPDPAQDNPLPAGFSVEGMQSLVNSASLRLRLEMPTAVGFCMYIPREIVKFIGYLDEISFGRGFGEENDYCERAKRNGFKVRICDDLFIFHAGKSSFGAEGHALSRKNGEILEGKHPGYNAAVARFISVDPLNAEHTAIRYHLQRHAVKDEPALMILLHADPLNPTRGGTEAHVMDRVAGMCLKRVIIVYPNHGGSIDVVEILNGDVKQPQRFSYPLIINIDFWTRSHPEVEDVLLWIAIAFRVTAFSCDHLLGVPLRAIRTLKKAGLRYVVIIHDYYTICPSFNLLDARTDRPCQTHLSSEAKSDCVAECLGTFCSKNSITTVLEPRTWYDEHRALFTEILNDSELIISPTKCVRETVLNAYALPAEKGLVIPHGYRSVPQLPPASPRKTDGVLRVALIGAVAFPSKGGDLIVDVVKTSQGRIEWHFFGDTTLFKFEKRLEALGKTCVFHGSYARENIFALLREAAVDIALFSSIWAETFTYTLSESWLAGIPAVVPRLGAMAERVQETGFGWIVEPHNAQSAADMVDGLSRNMPEVERVKQALTGFKHVSLEENAGHYRKVFEPLLQPVKNSVAPYFLSMSVKKFEADDVDSREKFLHTAARSTSMAKKLRALGQVEIISSPVAQVLRSTGLDPQVQLILKDANHPIFKLEMDCPNDTKMQLFYVTAESPHFTEGMSIRRKVKKGRNEIFIDLPYVVKAIRLDPGETEGDYVIHSLEMKTLNEA